MMAKFQLCALYIVVEQVVKSRILNRSDCKKSDSGRRRVGISKSRVRDAGTKKSGIFVGYS